MFSSSSCSVCIDNESLEDCTVVKVDSVNKQGVLLEVVQVLTDTNLTISKGFISSDARWFMDVFHVKDVHGNKLTDQSVIDYIQQAIGATREAPNAKACTTVEPKPHGEPKSIKMTSPKPHSEPIPIEMTVAHRPGPKSHSSPKAVGMTVADWPGHKSNSEPKTIGMTGLDRPDPKPHSVPKAIEMTGPDRPGLLSEISAALADLHCNIVEAHAWSHNARLACVAYISDQSTDTPIDDHRLAAIEDHLNTVLLDTTAPNPVGELTSQQEVKTAGLPEGEGIMMTNVERRLHQLMLSVRDFDRPTQTMGGPVMLFGSHDGEEVAKPNVSIESCREKGYSIVTVQCRDRPRLMFDTVCTIMDMQYAIFHASIDSRGGYAFQEYFIRHIDGRALSTEGEKERVMKCLEAAIERRVCEGVHLELCAKNRVGLLSDITRVLRENGLVVVRADIATHEGKAVNNFYVRDISGNDVDMEFIESMKREMGPIDLAVKNEKSLMPSSPDQRPKFSIGDILRSRSQQSDINCEVGAIVISR
ncbi:ACT domain-containing protein [Actinidia chinensis var. chinensis]|uniref:ACT domain-containing protein ACR n=1 Tax=Actinidia chinensis var. chinensis TaxID=1590841 RepID=A0A2R6PIZ7_ACTCC|nr:ACT domain-containing protein [Actinidia chinensis var. chinensis]